MKNSKVNKVLLVLAAFYMAWWIITTFVYPHEYEDMVGVMISSASLMTLTVLCAISNKMPSSFSSAFAYFAAVFLIGSWLVGDYSWNALSFQLWVPVIAGVIAGMKHLSVKWIEGFLLGFWALTAFYFFSIPKVDAMMSFRIAFSYHGTQYALTHYWALLIIMGVYAFIKGSEPGMAQKPKTAVSIAGNPRPIDRLPAMERQSRTADAVKNSKDI